MLRLASRSISLQSIGALSCALLVASTAAACSPIDLDQRTEGNEGTLMFSYAGDAFLECLFGCGIDKPMMTHSSVRILVDGADPADVLTARASEKSAAVEAFEAHLSCTATDADGSVHDRDVTRDEPCAANEERRVFWEAEVAASSPGTFDLEIVKSGDVVDSLTLVAKDATRVEMRADGASDPVPTLKLQPGATRVVVPTFFAESGEELASGVRGDAWTFGDEAIARPGSPFELLFGPLSGVVVEGVAAGETAVNLKLGSSEFTLPIVVQ
ncbi:MAG: hypothetical protein U0414_30745 [Polyangiaceae bacterium]